MVIEDYKLESFLCLLKQTWKHTLHIIAQVSQIRKWSNSKNVFLTSLRKIYSSWFAFYYVAFNSKLENLLSLKHLNILKHDLHDLSTKILSLAIVALYVPLTSPMNLLLLWIHSTFFLPRGQMNTSGSTFIKEIEPFVCHCIIMSS